MDKGLNLYSKYRSFSQTYKVCLYQSITNCMFTVYYVLCVILFVQSGFLKKKKKYKSFKEMDSATTCFPSLTTSENVTAVYSNNADYLHIMLTSTTWQLTVSVWEWRHWVQAIQDNKYTKSRLQHLKLIMTSPTASIISPHTAQPIRKKRHFYVVRL